VSSNIIYKKIQGNQRKKEQNEIKEMKARIQTITNTLGQSIN